MDDFANKYQSALPKLCPGLTDSCPPLTGTHGPRPLSFKKQAVVLGGFRRLFPFTALPLSLLPHLAPRVGLHFPSDRLQDASEHQGVSQGLREVTRGRS